MENSQGGGLGIELTGWRVSIAWRTDTGWRVSIVWRTHRVAG